MTQFCAVSPPISATVRSPVLERLRLPPGISLIQAVGKFEHEALEALFGEHPVRARFLVDETSLTADDLVMNTYEDLGRGVPFQETLLGKALSLLAGAKWSVAFFYASDLRNLVQFRDERTFMEDVERQVARPPSEVYAVLSQDRNESSWGPEGAGEPGARGSS